MSVDEKILAAVWRECHNPACDERFEPITRTQYHCSEQCAAECLKRRSA